MLDITNTAVFASDEAQPHVEADRAAQDRCPRQVHFPRLQDDGFVQRKMLVFLVFPDEDPQQHRVTWNLHGYTHLVRLNARAAR